MAEWNDLPKLPEQTYYDKQLMLLMIKKMLKRVEDPTKKESFNKKLIQVQKDIERLYPTRILSDHDKASLITHLQKMVGQLVDTNGAFAHLLDNFRTVTDHLIELDLITLETVQIEYEEIQKFPFLAFGVYTELSKSRNFEQALFYAKKVYSYWTSAQLKYFTVSAIQQRMSFESLLIQFIEKNLRLLTPQKQTPAQAVAVNRPTTSASSVIPPFASIRSIFASPATQTPRSSIGTSTASSGTASSGSSSASLGRPASASASPAPVGPLISAALPAPSPAPQASGPSLKTLSLPGASEQDRVIIAGLNENFARLNDAIRKLKTKSVSGGRLRATRRR